MHFAENTGSLYLDPAAAAASNHPSAAAPPLPRPWPDLPSSAKSLGSINSAACMEQLLVHCALAIEANDATLSQQLLWVLINLAPPDGDSNQRLTSAFLRALILRASRSGSAPCAALASSLSSAHFSATNAVPFPLRLPATALAAFIDLTPWHRFGFSAANAAIVDAVEGFSVLHLVDLSNTHSMQIPTLIDALAARPEGAPFLRLTVSTAGGGDSPPPTLDMSFDELGARLVSFARSRNVGMEFRVIEASHDDGFESLVEQLRAVAAGGEALVVNCHMMPHRIPDESAAGGNIYYRNISARTVFVEGLRSLDPNLVLVVEEEADFTAVDVVGRLRAAFNYLWIPFDAVDTFLPSGTDYRRTYEAAIYWKIENVIAQEGLQRVERLEPRSKWAQRMRSAGFHGIGFGEEAAAEVKNMLNEHSAGWGMRRDEDDLVLTWKGHDVVFATAWVPSMSTTS